ncbi:MAG: DUF1653 domain-containing protein [Bacilli bacterium]
MRKEEVLPSSRWKHFKGSTMEVIGTAKNSETLEDMIIYKHNEELWVRPISSFLDDEDISKRKDNVTGQKYRFERID